jgi:anti-sigma B factor antagonist
MPDIKISETLTGPDNDIAVLTVDGSVDAYNSEMLSGKLDSILKRKYYKIIVNCRKLNFISSSGMGVFLAMEDDLSEKGGGFKFIAVPATILNVFKKVGISDIFKICADENEAVSDFNKGL